MCAVRRAAFPLHARARGNTFGYMSRLVGHKLRATALVGACVTVAIAGCSGGSGSSSLPVTSPTPAPSATLGWSGRPSFVAYSRHTFRGYDETQVGPQKLSVGPLKDFIVPAVGYAMDATPQGLSIARINASAGLIDTQNLAAKTLSTTLPSEIGELLADFATERTVMTAAYIAQGLADKGVKVAQLQGLPTVPNAGIDAVSAPDPAKKCMPDDQLTSSRNASQGLPQLQTAGQNLLSTVGSIVGKPGAYPLPQPVYDDKGKLPVEYQQVASLASAIEMTAALGSPVSLVFKSTSVHLGAQAVKQSLDFLGLGEATDTPQPISSAMAEVPAQYLNQQLTSGINTLVVSHDDYMSDLVRGLGIVPDSGSISQLGFYPIETFVFARTQSKVAVVRMRIQVQPDGSMPGPYASQVAWTGTTDEWNQKVNSLLQAAQAFPVGLDCRNNLKIESATPLALELFR